MHKLPLHDHLHDQIFHPSTDDAATFITRCIWIITVHLILIIGALTHHMCQLGKPRVQNVARKAKQITLCLTPRRPQQYRTVPYLPSCCFHTPSTKKGALLLLYSYYLICDSSFAPLFTKEGSTGRPHSSTKMQDHTPMYFMLCYTFATKLNLLLFQYFPSFGRLR